MSSRAVSGQTRKVPLLNWVRVGQWHEASDAFQAGDADEWIESDVKDAHVFALRVKGDSMEPEFNEGDIIVVNPHARARNR